MASRPFASSELSFLAEQLHFMDCLAVLGWSAKLASDSCVMQS